MVPGSSKSKAPEVTRDYKPNFVTHPLKTLRGLVGTYPFWGYLKENRRRYAVGMAALVFVDALNVCFPLLIKVAVDALTTKNLRRIVWAGVAYFVLMALQSVGRYVWRVYLIGTSYFIANSLRVKLYDRLQRLPLSYFQNHRTGDLMSRSTNDIEAVRMALGPGILVAADAVLLFLMIVPAMLCLSVKQTLLACAFYPLVPLVTALLGRRIDSIYEQIQIRLSQLSSHVQESFGSIRLIKSLVLESQVQRRFEQLSRDCLDSATFLARYEAGFSPTLGLITNLGTFFILWVGGFDVMQGAITVGTFVAFQRFVVQLSWPMEAIGWAVTMNREGIAAHRRVVEIFDTPGVRSTLVESSTTKIDPDALLEIRDLSFRFDENPTGFRLQLEELQIGAGQKVGVVGAVGCGKSTIFQFLLRSIEPPPGTVFFRGDDVLSVPLVDLRHRIACVEQQILLFSESIRDNVTLGAALVGAGEMERALDSACFLEEVLRLEKGFDTVLGERGVDLSGGQKQRLALARALVRSPKLVLLDDCFSAVDVSVEERIIDKLFSRYPGLSVCFASHRLSVMPRMDEIWVMEKGRIIATGPHAMLLKTCTLYRQLWQKSEKQVKAEIIGNPIALEGTSA